MRSTLSFVKASIIGGVFFLVPVAMLLLVVGKVVPVLMSVERGILGVLPRGSAWGLLAVQAVGVFFVLLLCFVAGLAAQSESGRRLASSLEEGILGALPGYTFFKGFTSSMQQSDEIAQSFRPVLIRFDDYSQVAFEIERIEETKKVVTYLPGAPNPWSGTVAYVDADRVQAIDLPVPQVIRNIRMLGRGSTEQRKSVVPASVPTT
jgi:uncharacterized membrane protein